MDRGLRRTGRDATRQAPIAAEALDRRREALESLPGTASPVFRDDNGAQLALGGGVVVRLRAADRAYARERLASAGLQPVRPLDPDGHAWLVASPAGMPALELANRLHESNEFESAAPNWWRPRSLK